MLLIFLLALTCSTETVRFLCCIQVHHRLCSRAALLLERSHALWRVSTSNSQHQHTLFQRASRASPVVPPMYSPRSLSLSLAKSERVSLPSASPCRSVVVLLACDLNPVRRQQLLLHCSEFPLLAWMLQKIPVTL